MGIPIILFLIYKIYAIQIDHNNSYQNYMRLERNVQEHERASNLDHYCDPVLGSSKTKVEN